MSMIDAIPLLAGAGADGGYQISRSVRLRSSASAYFNRTPSVIGNRKTFTWSGWVKIGQFGVASNPLFGAIISGTSNVTEIAFDASNRLDVFSQNTAGTVIGRRTTTQVFRDPSAWYHIVVAIDTSDATASNRIKLYVNGNQITSFAASTDFSLNDNTGVNDTTVQRIGARASGTYFFDGYLTEINFIDGQALTPSSFGETNSVTGVWQPKRYAGTYGTNGFYLPFTLNANSTYAGSFNGSSQGLTTTATGINPSTGSWTIEGWAYSTNAAANEAIITGQVSGSDYLYWNYVGTTLYIGDGVTNILTISNAKPTNQWYHWALVKNGSTYTAYINGQPIGSSTTALRSGTLTTWQIGIRTSVSYYWNGSISNVRVNSTTAIYTTKFTPPISPLTAISGTQLLTLQDATIIDNSTNAYSITNTGSVATTTSTAVFAAPTIGSDASGNVNNWTANNINVSTTGATYDSMIDVPTLYADGGNGRGNYCTLNPLATSTIYTTSKANLQVSGAATSSATHYCHGTLPVSTGKWYFEVTPTDVGGGPNIYVGVKLPNTSVNNVGAINTIQNGYGYGGDGNKISSGVVAYGATYTNNDVVGVALDLDAGTIVFYKNNVSQGTAFTGLTGEFVPVIAMSVGGTARTIAAEVNFGQRPFTYTPPTGFKALNTQNLPTPTISNGATVMAATLWTGNGTTQSISNAVNGVSFQPDFVWVKSRQYTTVGHSLFDALRPIGVNSSLPRLVSNSTDAETNNGGLTAFVSNGFSLNNDAYINSTSTGGNMVAWQWNAGGSTVTNTSGTISAQVRANPTAGFSVVTYTGNGTSGATVGHGLGAAPKMIIVKRRDASTNWPVWHTSVSSGTSEFVQLNLTTAKVSDATFFTTTAPTSSVFSLGTGSGQTNTGSMVAYCFSEVAGYSAFGKYTGNGSADGPFVYLGFRPRWIMFKRTDVAEGWQILDTARNTVNVVNSFLEANQSNAEGTSTARDTDYTANGFKARNTSAAMNASGGTYIFAAFAEVPFRSALAR